MSEKHSGRGRKGESRYKYPRQKTIDFEEFETIMKKIKIENVEYRSLVAFLYYLALRIAEICGDKKRKWKKLTPYGTRLSKDGALPKDWKETEEGELWYWKERGPLPGIVKEDIALQGDILRVVSKPLKRGKRKPPGGGEGVGELELDVRYPYVDEIVEQWKRTEKGKKVWDITTWKAWDFLSKLTDSRVYPHAFRTSRATVMARNPQMSIAVMQYQFGWARAMTADSYILGVQSAATARIALADEIPPELRPKIEQ